MGWTFSPSWKTKAQLAANLTRDENSASGHKYRTLAKKTVGNAMYAVQEHTDPEGKVERFIGVYLFEVNRGQWGYKDMSEGMGPYAWDCPLNYFDMVPDPGGYATEWRATVRQHHASKRATVKPEVGARYRLINSKLPEMRVTSVKPLRGEYQGRVYRGFGKMLGERIDQPAPEVQQPTLF